jgi:Aldo/keto reductase family
LADVFHQVAIAYLMQKTPFVFPIIGGRKVEHLLANIEALEITLSDDQIKYLESVVSFEAGFPYWIIVSLSFFSMAISRIFLKIVFSSQGDGKETVTMLGASASVVKGPLLQPLRP